MAAHPAPCLSNHPQGQKQAAAALNVGYSTFRRQAGEARKALAHELWRREKTAR